MFRSTSDPTGATRILANHRLRHQISPIRNQLAIHAKHRPQRPINLRRRVIPRLQFAYRRFNQFPQHRDIFHRSHTNANAHFEDPSPIDASILRNFEATCAAFFRLEKSRRTITIMRRLSNRVRVSEQGAHENHAHSLPFGPRAILCSRCTTANSQHTGTTLFPQPESLIHG